MAMAGVVFAVACVLVLVANLNPGTTYAVLVAAAVLVGVGECYHTTALMPLVAISLPPHCAGATWQRWDSRGGSA